jgi:16S rRNA (uracil1498-N3)-methyltransferase
MARRRFFVDRILDGQAVLAGDDARHLAKVLRAQIGQRYELSDNRSVHLAEIVEIARDRVRFRILEPVESPLPSFRVTLLASLIRFDRFEWMVEKATELGVDAILPLHAARSEAGLLEAARKRVARWRKLARESSQQARRTTLPEILPPAALEGVAAQRFTYRYALEEKPGAANLWRALPPPELRRAGDAVALLVGPEGGWTEPERLLLAASWTPVSLGPLILRAETAAVAALAIVTNLWR